MHQNLPVGFIDKAKTTAEGSVYQGRFTCHDVQWAGEGQESLVTFTITAEELADAAESQLLWTDQDVQRGVRPEVRPRPERELSVGDGYPDPKKYIFQAHTGDQIAEKLLHGKKLFLSPLIWNLRPGSFTAFYDASSKSIFIYTGKIFLPDSHHRQQGILKAVRHYRDSPAAFPAFSPNRKFNVQLYFLSREDEGNYFFDKNQRPTPTANSKAYDLSTLDDLSILAKAVTERSKALKDNVNRVTDRLTSLNSHVLTLSTLREMMKRLTSDSAVDKLELDGLAHVAATFYDFLSEARPELGLIDIESRKKVRERLIVDAAVMMHGYAALMEAYNRAIPELGTLRAEEVWRKKLARLSSKNVYTFGDWSGDLFEKRNPLWQRIGIVKPSKDAGKLTVLNTGGARSECARVLIQLTAASDPMLNLEFLSAR